MSQNTEVTYGDKGGPYVWDFEDKPEAPQYTTSTARRRAGGRPWRRPTSTVTPTRGSSRCSMQRTLFKLAERAAALLGHYKGLDLPNSDNPGIQSGCQLAYPGPGGGAGAASRPR